MAAGPIEMTAALHDLKVRRQRIIFQWWRRGIGGVKWCLSITPPLLLSWIIAEQPRWNQHCTKPHHHYTYTQHTTKTDRIASVFSALIHHNEKFCDWKFRRSVRKTRQHNEPPCFLYRVIILQNFPETKLYSCSSVPLKSNSIYTEYWVKQINSRANYAIILHKGWPFCLQTWLLMRFLCLRRYHKKREN